MHNFILWLKSYKMSDIISDILAGIIFILSNIGDPLFIKFIFIVILIICFIACVYYIVKKIREPMDNVKNRFFGEDKVTSRKEGNQCYSNVIGEIKCRDSLPQWCYRSRNKGITGENIEYDNCYNYNDFDLA